MKIITALFVVLLTAFLCYAQDVSKLKGKRSEPGQRFAPNQIETPYGVYDNTEMKRFFNNGRDPFQKTFLKDN